MSDERLLGVLIEFKSGTERTLEDIKESIKEVKKQANDAEERAKEAHAYSRSIVQKVQWVAGGVTVFITGLIYFIEHIPQAIAKITGVH